MVIAFFPGDRDAGPPVIPGTTNPGKYVIKTADPGAGDLWYEGDVLVLDLTNFDVTTLSNIFDGLDGGGTSGVGLAGNSFTHFAPPGTVITDVLSVYHNDGHTGAAINQEVQLGVVTGLGTPTLTLALDANDLVADTGGVFPDHRLVGSGGVSDGSGWEILLEVEITYPIGVGSTDTPTEVLVPDTTVYPDTGVGCRGPGPKIENDNSSQRPYDLDLPLPPKFREGHREINLEYQTDITSSHVLKDTDPVLFWAISRTTTSVYPPRRIATDTIDTFVQPFGGAAAPIDPVMTEFGSSSRKIVPTAILPDDQTLCLVSYHPQDAIPNYGPLGGGYQVAVYYRANSPQTAGIMEGVIDTGGGGTLPITLTVEPLLMGPGLFTGQTGMGSVDIGFPYSAPLDQIPVNEGTVMSPAVIREWYFCATADVSIADFDAQTGFLSLHPFLPVDIQNNMVFGGVGAEEVPRVDAEFRAFYPMADVNTYRPTIMSQPLTGMVRHKVFSPILARATEDVPGLDAGLLYRKNELLLIVLSRFAELDDDNTVRFNDDPTLNRTCAALYRTRNLLLVVGDRGIPPNP
jgi:hypothetical protein